MVVEMNKSSAGEQVLRIEVRYCRLIVGLQRLFMREWELSDGPGDGTGVGGDAIGMYNV